MLDGDERVLQVSDIIKPVSTGYIDKIDEEVDQVIKSVELLSPKSLKTEEELLRSPDRVSDFNEYPEQKSEKKRLGFNYTGKILEYAFNNIFEKRKQRHESKQGNN